MSEHFSWFSRWREARVTCRCGWSGPLTDDHSEIFDALLELRCPACDAILALVSFPTEDEIEAEMEAGHPEAEALWPEVLEVRRRRAERARTRLSDPADLPDLEGDALSFRFDAETLYDTGWYIVRCDGREVWRERSGWEDWERFNEVKRLLQARYGARFVGMDPTRAAELTLYGDRLSAPRLLERT